MRKGSATLSNGLQRLADKAGKTIARQQRSTVATRKSQLLADLQEFNVDRLVELQEQMSGFVDLITLSLGEGLVLSQSESTTLMMQYLSSRDIDEFMTVCRDCIKEIVFKHLDATLEAEGCEDPENTNGGIEVPALGKRFVREGCGYKDPSLDEGKLRLLLGDKIWSEVCDTVVIPEYTEHRLSVDRLMKLAEEDPSMLEKIRDCLTSGEPKTPRFTVRDI